MPNTETIQNYDDIFTDDKLNIKSNVIDFAHLIEQDTHKNNQTSKVYSISAEFGIGKTFFCDKLLQVLAKDKVKVGKLNIWEMDFYENPLIPILAELNKLYAKEGEHLPTKIVNMMMSLGKKATDVISEVSLRVGYNCAIGQLTQMPGSENLVKAMNEADLWNICKEKISSATICDDYYEYQQTLDKLKKCLLQWSSKQKDKPIVVIIDELDRCKPDYAIKTLEILKHIFDIPGFVFVLALDEEQLKNSVQTLFGTVNYEGYKRKFINNSFILPQPDRLAFTEYLYEKSDIRNYLEQIQKDKRELVFRVDVANVFFCAHQYSEYGNMNKREASQKFNQTQTSENIIKRYFAAYSECFNLSLRQMEQVFDRLLLFTKQINASRELFSPDLATFLICLHEGNAQLFNKIRNIKNVSTPILSYIFAHTANSMVYKIYNEKAFSLFNKINRKIIPEVIPVSTYSYIVQYGSQQKVISDNIDRFYIENYEQWMYQHDAINTNNVLASDGIFDKEQFKENYCRHIDFISHFE